MIRVLARRLRAVKERLERERALTEDLGMWFGFLILRPRRGTARGAILLRRKRLLAADEALTARLEK
jgi:hypothetical protein